MKLDRHGDIQWQQCFGGSYYDNGEQAVQTSDSGFLIAGHTYSYDGEVHGNHGRSDEWILKLTKNGNLQWQKTFGGTKHDFFRCIIPAAGNKYIVIGSKGVAYGEDTLQEGYQATLADEIDEKGNLIWEKNYSGVQINPARNLDHNGYFFAGSTGLFDVGGKADGVSNYDFRILNIDTSGNLLWQGNFGGKGDDINRGNISKEDGSYLLAGNTRSSDGDVAGNHGENDFWVIKIDSTGKIRWQHCYGGLLSESLSSVVQTPDGGFIMSGGTSSLEGDVHGNHGLDDAWLIKIDGSGKLLWQKCIGGSNNDEAENLALTDDGGLVIVGNTESHDGDVSLNHGKKDLWVVKLKLNQ